eukprot:6432518-Pyramimonas_sp.AAC.1
MTTAQSKRAAKIRTHRPCVASLREPCTMLSHPLIPMTARTLRQTILPAVTSTTTPYGNSTKGDQRKPDPERWRWDPPDLPPSSAPASASSPVGPAGSSEDPVAPPSEAPEVPWPQEA